ncbi:MAG: Nramp family divalent metal transporter [bacterium]
MENHKKSKEHVELESLKLPTMLPSGLATYLGPGVILMMTGIGTSHLISAPTAGGRFAYALLWCIPIAYIFKYYGFEMAFRFTNATGKSIIEAYATAWKKWPLWYVLVTTLLQCAIGQAGRLIAASAVLYYFFNVYLGFNIPIALYGFFLGVLSILVILKGKYAAIELSAKLAAGVLVLSTFAVYFAKPAPLSAMSHFFIFEAPQGSWLIIAAFLGLLPTGIDVSLQASEWGKAKNVGMAKIRTPLERMGLTQAFDCFTSKKEDLTVNAAQVPPHALEYCRRWFRIGLWDFRIGHWVSFIIVCLFLLLAAVWLYPNPVEGRAVIGEIAKIFTESIGPEMMVVFLFGAFAATYSTAFNYFDGWPRIVGACCRNMFKQTAKLPGTAQENLSPIHKSRWYSEYNIYRLTMVYSLFAAVAIIAGVPKPVWLVLIASALAFFIAPVIFFLNLYYCLTVIPKEDKDFYPSAFAKWFGVVSLVVFTGLSVLLILVKIFNVEL